MESKPEFHGIDLDALTLPAPRAGLHWWRAKHAARGAVRRSEVEPLLEIPRLLANTMLLARESGEWRVRLVGTELDRQFGRKLAQLTVAQAFPKLADPLRTLLDRAVHEAAPKAMRGVAHIRKIGEALHWQGVLLPLEHAAPHALAILGWTVELLAEPSDDLLLGV
jgi:hypothetical protein